MPLPLAASDLGNGMILIVIALVVLPIAAIAFAGSGAALKTLGKGRWAIEQELPAKRPLGTPQPVNKARPGGGGEADAGGQVLPARAAGREPARHRSGDEAAPRAGASPASGIDSELREEVRQLVVARNERRMRQGKPPLDVEAEIRRQLHRSRESRPVKSGR